MEHNIIATLIAMNESAGALFRQPHNAAAYIAPSQLPPPKSYDLSSRETTLSSEEEESYSSRIQLSFEKPPRDIVRGFTFGRDEKICDIYLPKSSISNELYLSKLSSNLGNRQSASLPLNTLRLSTRTTPRSSRVTSPRQRPWYYQGKELGRGSFGRVYEARDVTTGYWYAVKEFFQSERQKEIEVMKNLSHVGLFSSSRKTAKIKRTILCSSSIPF